LLPFSLSTAVSGAHTRECSASLLPEDFPFAHLGLQYGILLLESFSSGVRAGKVPREERRHGEAGGFDSFVNGAETMTTTTTMMMMMMKFRYDFFPKNNKIETNKDVKKMVRFSYNHLP
jgi:hypothetical protein